MKVLILEDDKYTTEYIKKLVSREISCSNFFLANSKDDALAVIKSNCIDLMILDIDIDKNVKTLGIDIAKLIFCQSPNTDFIVISEHEEYAIDVFDFHPYYYFKKPLNEKKFKSILCDWELSRNCNIHSRTSHIKINTLNGITIINPNDIIFIENVCRKIRIVTNKNTYEVSDTLKNLERRIPSNFYKTYQSFLVNMNYIESMKVLHNRTWEIEFKGIKETALLSRYKSKDFFETFEKLM